MYNIRMARNGYYKEEKHAFQQFAEDLKQDAFRNLIFLRGEEQYLVQWAKRSLMDTYVPEATKALDFAGYAPDSFDLDQLIGACETPAMMASKKVVLLDNFYYLWKHTATELRKEDEEALKAYFSKIPETCLLIICAPEPQDQKAAKFGTSLSKALEKHAQVYNFKRLDKKQLMGFIKKQMVAHGKAAGIHTMEKLIGDCGYYNKEIDYGLFHLVGDIQKMCAYAQGEVITDRDVEECLSENLEHNIFRMLDCVSTNRKEEALRLLSQLIKMGTDAYRVLYQLQSQFDYMLCIRQMRAVGLSKDKMAKQLGIQGFRLQKLMENAGRASEEQLKKMLRESIDAERNIKQGKMDPQFALELLIAAY